MNRHRRRTDCEYQNAVRPEPFGGGDRIGVLADEEGDDLGVARHSRFSEEFAQFPPHPAQCSSTKQLQLRITGGRPVVKMKGRMWLTRNCFTSGTMIA